MMFRLFFLSSLILLANIAVVAQEEELVVLSDDGTTITGTYDSATGVGSFLGIKYATIAHRFAPSQILELHNEVSAMAPGPACPQPRPIPQSDDCLFLNVFRPDGAAKGGLPVMVFIHGGGFVVGEGAKPEYNGKILAEEGNVIVVSINYRLGVFGLLVTEADGTGGMNPIGDQMNALQWIQDNIALFGGDPNQVTLFGNSIGG